MYCISQEGHWKPTNVHGIFYNMLQTEKIRWHHSNKKGKLVIDNNGIKINSKQLDSETPSTCLGVITEPNGFQER